MINRTRYMMQLTLHSEQVPEFQTTQEDQTFFRQYSPWNVHRHQIMSRKVRQNIATVNQAYSKQVLYSLTFCIRVMLPERHHWKPAVQATAVMLRTTSVDGQSPASQPRPLAIYGAQCWERLRHPPVTNQQRALTPSKLGFQLLP